MRGNRWEREKDVHVQFLNASALQQKYLINLKTNMLTLTWGRQEGKEVARSLQIMWKK